MKRLITAVFVASAIFVTGCASTIMNSYISKDVREVMLDYGPPSNAFDMGDGRRAFQWVMKSSYVTPVVANTSGNFSAYGNTAWVNSNTTISGGQAVTSSCTYTMLGRWDDSRKGWIITEFRKPNLMCE